MRSTRTRHALRLARHALWGGLVGLHCVPLVQVVSRLLQGGEGWGSLVALLLTQAVFAAKWADVRWLRLPSRQGAVIAFLLATVLAHPQATVEQLGQAAPEAGAAVLVLAPAVARSRPRRAARRLLRSGGHAVSLWIDAVAVGVRREVFLAPAPRFVAPVPPGRAPPVKSFV